MADLAVLIAGGGTGGHLYPGIAVAREILRRVPGATVTFAGTSRGLEARVVPREGFALDLIRSAGLKGKSTGARLRGAALLPGSLLDAWRVLSRRRPKVVVGVGGYSSGPVVLLAALRRIPTMVLEQNAVPGLTNRLLAPWVRAAAVTYDATTRFFRSKAIVSGNPVRAEFFADTPGPTPIEGRRLLVLGGSQGAHAINVTMPAAAPSLTTRYGPMAVVHQTGTREVETVRAAYRAAGVAARVEPFLDEVAIEMRQADLVVCRAGATTLAELAACRRPAVLVPFPGATDDHQRKNAEVLEAARAAVMIQERDLTGIRLAAEVNRILEDDDVRHAMGRAMHGFARPDAAAKIVDTVLKLVQQRGR